MYTKESLETLKNRIDLYEALAPHISLNRAGATHKALCPFHEEKSPSFVVNRGDKHYHCFGCGAHGDAISFYMLHLKMGFTESVELLAEKFSVMLEKSSGEEGYKGTPKTELKNVLDKASEFFHFYLLHAQEALPALHYLFNRGIDLSFIEQFQIGYAPADRDLMRKVLQAKQIDDRHLEETALVTAGNKSFFSERITFPIRDRIGAVIGFSARKIREETFGGKYINSKETALFKKSRVLYGLYECRKRISNEQQVIIVEGQIDALRMIHAGFNYTLAGQGTAFGDEHVKEVMALGVKKVFLMLDGDTAGKTAAAKIGDLFMKEGVETLVVPVSDGADPDTLLRDEGPPGVQKRLDSSVPYLDFLVELRALGKDLESPAVKNEIAQTISTQVRTWNGDLLIYESLKSLARHLKVPESVLGVHKTFYTPTFYKKKERISFLEIDSDSVLEGDLLRWLFLLGESKAHFLQLVELNLKAEHFKSPLCKKLFERYFEQDKERDLLSITLMLEEESEQQWLTKLMQKKVNLAKADDAFQETIQRILQREWLEKREAIKLQIQSGTSSDEEIARLAQLFDSLKPPKLQTVPVTEVEVTTI